MLWISQLSLPSLQGRQMSSNHVFNYMDYGDGDHQTADQGCALLSGCRSESVCAGFDYGL